MKNLTLSRPLVVLDLETTGVDPKTARIVEVGCKRYAPDAEPVIKVRRVNPGIPIPAEATAIHGITDADVAGCPPFSSLAQGLLDAMQQAGVYGDDCQIREMNLRFGPKVEGGRATIRLTTLGM